MTDRYEPNAAARRIAFFISPHGFGHAARAASVMEALAEIESSIQFDIFTTVPEWFFAHSNNFTFQYHRLETDIGLVQKTPFQEDLPATVQKLKKFLSMLRKLRFLTKKKKLKKQALCLRKFRKLKKFMKKRKKNQFNRKKRRRKLNKNETFKIKNYQGIASRLSCFHMR